jgi:GAF domain-containing protein
MLANLEPGLATFDDEKSIVEWLLARSLAATGARLGNVQLVDWTSGDLLIVAQQGFRARFLQHFEQVNSSDACACGKALDARKAVVIEDVVVDPGFAPHRDVAIDAGFRSVQSTPIISANGALVGVVSTHFGEAGRPNEGQLMAVRVAAELAASGILRARAKATSEDVSRQIAVSEQAVSLSLKLLAKRPDPWPSCAADIAQRFPASRRA